MQVIESKPYGPGKFNTTFDEWLYQRSLDGCDSECGEVDGPGYYSLLLFPDGVTVVTTFWSRYTEEDIEEYHTYYGAILREDSQGFVYSTLYTSEEEAQTDFDRIEAEIYGEDEEEDWEEDSEF